MTVVDSVHQRRVLIVSSVGGHLTEVMQLQPAFEDCEVSLVVNDQVRLPKYPFRRVYRVSHAERDWRVAWNLVEALTILDEVRPDVLLSTGAGPIVPFALIARLLAGVRIVYVETAAAIERPTLTGRLMYPLAHHFFYQWRALDTCFPRGRLLPLVFPPGPMSASERASS